MGPNDELPGGHVTGVERKGVVWVGGLWLCLSVYIRVDLEERSDLSSRSSKRVPVSEEVELHVHRLKTCQLITVTPSKLNPDHSQDT